MNDQPLAIIDSGLGGLSIAQALWQKLPNETTIYLADHLFFPYGEKSVTFINRRLIHLIDFCLAKNCKLIVIACNTITANSIAFLRSIYPILFIGTEPAIKPAIEAHLSENIIVWATSATVAKLHQSSQVQAIACPDLAPAIEKYGADPNRLEPIIKQYLSLIKTPYSALVLGCTHYILIKDLLRHFLPANVMIIEPSEAIAKQTEVVLSKNQLLSHNPNPKKLFFTTKNAVQATKIASTLLKRRIIFTACNL